jgi:phosphinothricin acetyltransferase
MIRLAKYTNASRLADIYNYYVTNTTATFEIEPISSDDMRNRIKNIESHSLPWLVCENKSGEIHGYAYASQWKERTAYRHSVEIAVYLEHNLTAQGLGS